jgi:plastocyanin
MTRARAWVMAVCVLCAAGLALATFAPAAPPPAAPPPAHRACRAAPAAHCAARACRAAHARRSARRRCPRAHHHGRQPGRPGHAGRTPAPPAGSAGPAHPNPSTPVTAASPGTLTAAAGAGAAPTGSGETPAGAPVAPPAPARVQVVAREYSFTLSRPEVPAGEVIVELVNRGEDAHNLHVAAAADGTEAGAAPNTEPGKVDDLRVTLRAGSYTLFCSLPGHEAKGMHATLLVR